MPEDPSHKGMHHFSKYPCIKELTFIEMFKILTILFIITTLWTA